MEAVNATTFLIAPLLDQWHSVKVKRDKTLDQRRLFAQLCGYIVRKYGQQRLRSIAFDLDGDDYFRGMVTIRFRFINPQHN